MAVEIDSIQAICDEVTREVEQVYEGLSLYFILHGTGKFNEAAALAEHDIVGHRAARAARAIIQKTPRTERSGFLGIGIATEIRMMGFKNKAHLLGLFNINKDHYKNEIEVRAQIYHLIWHAIDLYEIRNNPTYARKFKDGPMVPKRSALNLSKAHLQADIFACALLALKDKGQDFNEKILIPMSQKRGRMALTPINNYKAEDFPSVIAMDSCNLALKEAKAEFMEEKDFMIIARKISLDVGQTYNQNNIQQWWDFCIPAQDMAWRGYAPEEILGAASNTSENPYVRSVAYLIEEVTQIKPASAEMLQNKYNAFVDPEINKSLHREMIDTIFEDAITKGAEESSHQALVNAANKQNEDLTEGRILGWCANALQEAAKAFERALSTGMSPIQAARMVFEGSRHTAEWDDLKDLGDKIVDQRKQGFAVTMGHIAEICHNHPAFSPILDSIKITMNDPSYIQKLQASNDLSVAPRTPSAAPTQEMAPKAPSMDGPSVKGPAPSEPTPQAPVPTAPVMPAAAPGMGGGNRAAYLMRQRQMMLQKQQELLQEQEEENSNLDQ
ncbi:MAG: hypothetical protein R3D88_06195 [Alphaproteobacteria bacterium]